MNLAKYSRNKTINNLALIKVARERRSLYFTGIISYITMRFQQLIRERKRTKVFEIAELLI